MKVQSQYYSDVQLCLHRHGKMRSSQQIYKGNCTSGVGDIIEETIERTFVVGGGLACVWHAEGL